MQLPQLIARKVRMVFSQKKESLAEENVWYFDRWAKTYDRYVFRWFMKRAQYNTLAMIDAAQKKDFSVLDVGCGTGEGLRMLKEKTKGRIVGVDLSSEMLARARAKIQGVELYPADVEHLPFNTASFDVVVSTEAFHHCLNPERALREMHRVLKKGGELIIADCNFRFTFLNLLFERFEPGCVHIYSQREMRSLFQAHRLHDIQQRRTAIVFFITKGMK